MDLWISGLENNYCAYKGTGVAMGNTQVMNSISLEHLRQPFCIKK